LAASGGREDAPAALAASGGRVDAPATLAASDAVPAVSSGSSPEGHVRSDVRSLQEQGMALFLFLVINPILHTAWLESHALTLKNNTAKYYFGQKSSFLYTNLKFSLESRTIQISFKTFYFECY
jgi:hypothetical protein